jgi:hypothetical protein
MYPVYEMISANARSAGTVILKYPVSLELMPVCRPNIIMDAPSIGLLSLSTTFPSTEADFFCPYETNEQIKVSKIRKYRKGQQLSLEIRTCPDINRF